MPPAPDPDEAARLALQADLSSSQLTALAEGCRALGVRLERWRSVPTLATTFETFAVLNAAEALQVGRGLSRTKALKLAAGRLDVSAGAVRRLLSRWREQARGAA